MKIILTNGTELNLNLVTGEKRYVQGATRDCLTFVFENTSLDMVDNIFTEANCETINIIGDDGTEALYKGYAIRAELKKEQVETVQATATTPAEYATRVFLTMAERTYSETKLAETSDAVDAVVLQMLMM